MLLVSCAHVVGLPALTPEAVLIISGIGLIAGLPHGGVDHDERTGRIESARAVDARAQYAGEGESRV